MLINGSIETGLPRCSTPERAELALAATIVYLTYFNASLLGGSELARPGLLADLA